jgi:hypothetical protein
VTGPPSDDPVVRCHVVAPTADDLRAFVDEVQPDIGCRPVVRRSGNGLATDVYLQRSRLEAARGARSAAAVTLEEVEDVTANWESVGRRSAGATASPPGRRPAWPRPQGVSVYLNVDEIESAVDALAAAYPDETEV